jgi:hypothetical protein
MGVPQWAKNAFAGRDDKVLRGMTQRVEALREIEGTRGYQLIVGQANKEIEWAKSELVYAGPFEVSQLQQYLKAWNVILNFISTTNKNGDVAAEVLADRPKQMDIDAYHALTFRSEQ